MFLCNSWLALLTRFHINVYSKGQIVSPFAFTSFLPLLLHLLSNTEYKSSSILTHRSPDGFKGNVATMDDSMESIIWPWKHTTEEKTLKRES